MGKAESFAVISNLQISKSPIQNHRPRSVRRDSLRFWQFDKQISLFAVSLRVSIRNFSTEVRRLSESGEAIFAAHRPSDQVNSKKSGGVEIPCFYTVNRAESVPFFRQDGNRLA